MQIYSCSKIIPYYFVNYFCGHNDLHRRKPVAQKKTTKSAHINTNKFEEIKETIDARVRNIELTLDLTSIIAIEQLKESLF